MLREFKTYSGDLAIAAGRPDTTAPAGKVALTAGKGFFSHEIWIEAAEAEAVAAALIEAAAASRVSA